MLQSVILCQFKDNINIVTVKIKIVCGFFHLKASVNRSFSH